MSLLTNIFGPPRADIWTAIAYDIGGNYIHGGLFGKSAITLKHREWDIMMDHFSRGGKNRTRHTRMRAPFGRKTDFLFQIKREGTFSSVGKLLGMQDIQLGDDFFDEQFIIKANNIHHIKHLLDDEELKNYIMHQPKILLKIRHEHTSFFKTGHPDFIDELYFECRGIMKNEEIIKDLFSLFTTILDRLVLLDLAYEGRPNYRLY